MSNHLSNAGIQGRKFAHFYFTLGKKYWLITNDYGSDFNGFSCPPKILLFYQAVSTPLIRVQGQKYKTNDKFYRGKISKSNYFVFCLLNLPFS